MIKIEKTEVVGWEHAIRGMRNPMNSWEKSDSAICYHADGCEKTRTCASCPSCYDVGPNDHELMMKLKNAGSDHRKFIRYLEVYLDITAPLYWWKEFKTYRHGRKFMDDEDFFDYDDEILEMHIETNSCSTMHKIHEKEFTLEDFSCEHLMDLSEQTIPYSSDVPYVFDYREVMRTTIDALNTARGYFLETKNKTYWWQMIQLLPSSYNQKRTVKLSYEVLARMYRSRKNHKLDEWREFCKWIEQLPYSEIITGGKNDNE